MTISMYQTSVPIFIRTLTALSAIIDKTIADAAARKIDPPVFITARLAPDMFAFARQVQIACDMAKNTSARLAGVEIPKFPDDEKTFEELKNRIAKTIDFLRTLKPAQIDGTEDKEIILPIGSSSMTFNGQDYLLTFGYPNFYFHVTTAYDILRHNGVGLGKRDFLGVA